VAKIYYRSGYKYQLASKAVFERTIITPRKPIQTGFISLDTDGTLTLAPGYAWDGPSGPTYDSKNSLRASLLHDSIYQLMRLEHLHNSWREKADIMLDKILEQDGMWKVRRWYWLKGVRWFASSAAKPDNAKVVQEAP